MVYKRIRNLREDKDLTQEEMAEYLNVSQRAYSYYESGERNIPVEILAKLAKFHKTTIEYLIDQTNKK